MILEKFLNQEVTFKLTDGLGFKGGKLIAMEAFGDDYLLIREYCCPVKLKMFQELFYLSQIESLTIQKEKENAPNHQNSKKDVSQKVVKKEQLATNESMH